MAPALTQRCLHHPTREAVARCPECEHFFCRECITEHEDRVICSSCLRKVTATVEKRRRNFAPLGRAAAAAIGVLLAGLFFFLVGRMLVNIPAKFHEGSVWQAELEKAVEGEQ